MAFETRYGNLGQWHSADDRATWTIEGASPGKYTVIFEWACDKRSAGNRFIVQAGRESLSSLVSSTDSWDSYRTSNVGTITLTADTRTIELTPVGRIQGALIDLKAIRLEKTKE